MPRFQTMRGRRVERRFGWDTHGLPAELEAMRQLGMKTTEEILDLGIEKFNAECRKSVFEYTSEWRDYVTRQARWVDFDNDYKTLDLPYMESVMWAFKQLHDKGLAYEGFRVLPYCWNDETPLSNHELRMDEDVYQPRVDPAVTVGLRLTSGPAEGALALVWTTTPWTLAANLAVMVGRDIDYVVVESDFTGTTGAVPARGGPAGGVREGARARAPTSSQRLRAPTCSRAPTRRRCPTTSATSGPSGSSTPTSSPPRTAPAWCTPPAPSVRRTRSSPTARASSRSSRWPRTASSPRRSTTTPACTSSRRTSRSSTTSGR